MCAEIPTQRDMRNFSRKFSGMETAVTSIGALVAEHARAMRSAVAAVLPRRRVAELRALYTADGHGSDEPTSAIQGQLLRLSERREAAIYLRGGTLWVADFIDGWGELVDAATWFRFNCGAPGATSAQRRMLLESALPLSRELVAKIDALHRPDGGRPRNVSPESRIPGSTPRDSRQEASHEPIF